MHGTAINPLNSELNPTCHLLALLGAHHIVHVSRVKVVDLLVEINLVKNVLFKIRIP